MNFYVIFVLFVSFFLVISAISVLGFFNLYTHRSDVFINSMKGGRLVKAYSQASQHYLWYFVSITQCPCLNIIHSVTPEELGTCPQGTQKHCSPK